MKTNIKILTKAWKTKSLNGYEFSIVMQDLLISKEG